MDSHERYPYGQGLCVCVCVCVCVNVQQSQCPPPPPPSFSCWVPEAKASICGPRQPVGGGDIAAAVDGGHPSSENQLALLRDLRSHTQGTAISTVCSERMPGNDKIRPCGFSAAAPPAADLPHAAGEVIPGGHAALRSPGTH